MAGVEQDSEPCAAAGLAATATHALPVPWPRRLARQPRSVVGLALTLLLGGSVATAGLLVVDGRPAGQPGVAHSLGTVSPVAGTSVATFHALVVAAPTGAPAGPLPAPPTVGTGPDGLARPGGPAPSQLPVVGALIPWSLPGASVSAGATAAHPSWAGTPPVGSGSVRMQAFPAPWRGGSYAVLHVGIYLPPGYASGARTYPVIFEAPFTYRSWQIGTSIAPTLDQLITSGTIPPAIVVFVPATGGPYPDAECANSADGREWLDRFISTTLVDWVDASYRTIPTPAARTVLGFSQGGYCAAALTLRHPDVFGSAVSISGYFSAGIRSSETPNAWRPFGRLPAVIAADSPMRLASTLAPVVRRSIFFVLAAQPGNPFFGGQAAAFAGVLERAGYPLAVIAAGRGHSWGQVRSVLAAALELVALRQARLGVPLNG